MKIFLDTANIVEIKKAVDMGLCDGITTNPTLMAKEGKSFKQIVNEICKIVDGPISAESISEKAEDIVREARRLSKIHKNIVVKIPITQEGLKAVNRLSKEGVNTNVTLVFSPQQAYLAAKAGATYVSPFVGRLDDIGENGMAIVKCIMEIFKNYNFKTKVIVASIRNAEHVRLAALYGADIATVPYKVLEGMFKHKLTDIGIKKFLDDYRKIPK